MKVSGDCCCDILSQRLQPFSLHEAFFMLFQDEYFYHILLRIDLEFLCDPDVTVWRGGAFP